MNSLATNNAIVRRPAGTRPLPDNRDWQNRFEIRSGTSNRIYTVAQNKASMKWGCSCPGYLAHRKCKHLIDGCSLMESQIHGRDRIEEKKREKFGGQG